MNEWVLVVPVLCRLVNDCRKGNGQTAEVELAPKELWGFSQLTSPSLFVTCRGCNFQHGETWRAWRSWRECVNRTP